MKPSMRTRQSFLPSIAFELFWQRHDELNQLIETAGGFLVDFNEATDETEIVARVHHNETTYRVQKPSWTELKAAVLKLPLFTDCKE
ncbi:MAG: hypothetical protein NXI22_09920 [bacterium]|nr:hypothetical protein [bacterium]